MNQQDYERFMAKVERTDGCWLWTAAKDAKGYGKVWVKRPGKTEGRPRSQTGAHRAMYEHVYGPIPPGPGFHGYCVLHRCDTPGCVNPDHLFLGTNKDNVHDMMRKGRQVKKQLKGSRVASAKLTEQQIPEIRKLLRSGMPQLDVARLFGVCGATISYINTKQRWRHVRDDHE